MKVIIMKNGIKIIFLMLNFCFVSDVLSSSSSAASDASCARTDKRYQDVAARAMREATQARLKREKSKKDSSDTVSASSNDSQRVVLSPVIARSIDRSIRQAQNHNADLNSNQYASSSNDKQTYWKDMALAYGVTLAATAIHEMGHAFALRALHKESQPINLGWYSDETPTLLSVPGMKLKLPLLPFWGFVKNTSFGKNHLKDITVALAGPIMGSLASYGIYHYLRKKYPKITDYQRAKSWSKGGIIGQLLNLIPLPGFDGAQIFSSFGKWLKS
jgi:Zn-dependent protease